MNRARAFSSPDLAPPITSHSERHEDYSLEGIATNVKLLLKLIQDHNEARTKDNDDRKVQRVAGMIKIIDDVKSRIEKSQSPATKKEFRRCNTDLRRNVPRDKKPEELLTDEKEIRFRKELNASLAARKSLEMLCSSLGKEKEIMASELARKVHELSGMEELINDLKAQNEMLLAKVQTCGDQHKERKYAKGETQGNAGLRVRNRELSEQLVKSLEGYRSLKRKLKDAKDENIGIFEAMEELRKEVRAGLARIHSVRQRMVSEDEQPRDSEEDISALERMFEGFNVKISKYGHKKNERVEPKAEIKATESSVLG